MSDGQIVIEVIMDDKSVRSGTAKIDSSIGSLSRSGERASLSIGKIATSIGLVKVAGKAFDLLKSSVGSSIKRFDTLNNSTRVFQNMGFSASETKRTMDTLKSSLQGLPTPLDSAVKSVQLLSSSTGDLGKSEEIFSALNNGILGFGGSTAQVENAVMQLSQAFSNGKVDAETWNSMIDSGLGPALAALAKDMGKTTGELKAGLSDGTISVSEFQNRLIKLNKEGGGGLQSLEKISKDAMGGIGTGFANMKTAIVRGVANVISKLDEMTKALTGRSIGENITVISTMIDKLFTFLVSSMDRVMPILEKIRTLTQNTGISFGKLSGIVGSLVAGFLGFKTITTILSKVSGVLGNIKSPFSSLAGNIPILGKGISNLGTKFASASTGILKVGAALGIATAGIGLMAMGLAQLAQTGSAGIITITAITLSIGALAAIFAVLGPILTANALGIGIFGAAILAIGSGIGIASAGLGLLIMSITQLETNMSMIIPTMSALGVGFAAMLTGFLTTLTVNIPLIVTSFTSMITQMLTALSTSMPQMVQSGISIILSILSGISANIGQITQQAINIIVTFAQTIVANMPTIVNAAVDLIVSFVGGLAARIPDIINAAVNLIVNFINGIANKIPDVVNAAMNLVDAMVQGVIQTQGRLMNAAITLINGFANNIRNRQGEIRSAGFNLLSALVGVFVPDSLVNAGAAIINGFLNGLKSGFERVKNFVGGIADWISKHKGPISYDKKLLITHGQAIMQSLNNGLVNGFQQVQDTISGIASELSDGVNVGLNVRASDNLLSLPKITPEAALGAYGQMASTSSIVNNYYTTRNNDGVHYQRPIIIENTVELDGRSLAKGTAKFTDEEIRRTTKLQNKIKGV